MSRTATIRAEGPNRLTMPGTPMTTSRRLFLSGATALAASLVAGRAAAQDVLGDIIKVAGNWDDTFDARAGQSTKVASTLPIFSPQTVSYTEQAIAQYQNIVSQGGWPRVPDTKKLLLGVSDADVVPLRQRLMVSGDLPQSAGVSPSFDSYVDSALKRFQLRHGLPADGVTGKYTYAAMNVAADIRLGQLNTNLGRLRARQHPRRPGGGRGERARGAAPYRDRRQDRPPDADRELPDQRDRRQPVLERPGLDRAQGHHPVDAQESELSEG